MPGRLLAWLGFVGALVALAYGSRAASGKPPKNALYQYSFAAGGLVQYGVMLGIVLLIAMGPESRALLALRPPLSWPRALGWCAGIIVGIYIITGIVSPFLHPGREQGLTPSGWQASHAGAFAANFVVIALVAPFVEELTFRGLGFSLLERYGRTVAIAVIGILFGLVHGLVEALPILVAFGAGLAWLRSRTGSVYPGMLVHATFNAIALAVAVTTT
jgi:membrane protease YdiL (CAAX protease family)